MGSRTEPLSRTARGWLIFAGLWCAALVTVFAFQQWQRYVVRKFDRDRSAAEAAHQEVLRTWYVEMADPSRSLLSRSGLPARKSRQDPATREQLRERLFPGRAPGTLPYAKPPGDGVAWDDPVRNVVFVIRFTPDGTWRSFQVRSRTPVLWQIDPLPEHPFLRRIEAIRALLVGAPGSRAPLPVLWCVLMVAALLPTRVSLKLGHVQLAVLLLCLLGWLIAGRYPLTPDGIAANIALRWGVVCVLIGSVALYLVIVRASSPHRDPRLCIACGYDLTGNVTGKCSECGARVVGSRNRLRPRPGPTSVLNLARPA
jgi:hypothetical protein